MEKTQIMKAKNVKEYFPIRKGIFSTVKDYVKAVDNVNFFIKKGETFGLVGESGCGKTTLGRTLIQLIPPTNGTVYFMGKNLSDISKSELRKLRLHMQIVFQDPSSSLNPRMTVKQIIGEPIKINSKLKNEEITQKVLLLLKTVGLDEQHMYRFPWYSKGTGFKSRFYSIR